jgi:hypothetical protein
MLKLCLTLSYQYIILALHASAYALLLRSSGKPLVLPLLLTC